MTSGEGAPDWPRETKWNEERMAPKMDDRMDDRADRTAPPTETEREVEMASFFGTGKEAMDRYTHCVLCGANLHFSHQTDFSRNLTQETAKCPECGIRVRSVMHRLQ